MSGRPMWKLKQPFKPALTGLITIISRRKCLPALWNLSLLTAGLFFSSWPLAASVSEVLKEIDIVYYVYFSLHSLHKEYNIHKIKGCHVLFYGSGFQSSGFYSSGLHGSADHAVLQCREYISLLRPPDIIKTWQKEQKAMGFFTLTMDGFGIKNVHGYIKKIKSLPFELFSVPGKKTKAGTVTGRFIRHVIDVRKYCFKNRTTGKISSVLSTRNHPFYVKNRGGFIPVEEISSEDEMIQKDGQIVKMNCSVPNDGHCRTQRTDSIVPVYNLEVARKHTYFVGQDFILVHNPYERSTVKRKRITFLERYSLFVKYGFISAINDHEENGQSTLAFTLPTEKMDFFKAHCGFSKAKKHYDILDADINTPLTRLGFVSRGRRITSGTSRLKPIIYWVLKNRVKFNKILGKTEFALPDPAPSGPELSSLLPCCSDMPPPLLYPSLPEPPPLSPPPVVPSRLPDFDTVGLRWHPVPSLLPPTVPSLLPDFDTVGTTPYKTGQSS